MLVLILVNHSLEDRLLKFKLMKLTLQLLLYIFFHENIILEIAL